MADASATETGGTSGLSQRLERWKERAKRIGPKLGYPVFYLFCLVVFLSLTFPYEKLKDLTRGKGGITRDDLHAFVRSLPLPEDAKARLLALTPATYIGLAAHLARQAPRS